MSKRILALLLTLLLSTGLLASTAYLTGTSGPILLHMMQTHAPAERTGLPAREYPAVAAKTADFLAGRTEVFQHAYSLDGMQVQAFNQKEQQHMADVRELFRLARGVMVTNLCLAIVLCGVVRTIFGWEALRKMLWFVGVSTLAAVTVLALAAAIDFDSLFILFHRIAFTNDLWLLDPRTDLLIRLMPTSFFISYAALIGLTWFTAMALLILLTHLLAKERNK